MKIIILNNSKIQFFTIISLIVFSCSIELICQDLSCSDLIREARRYLSDDSDKAAEFLRQADIECARDQANSLNEIEGLKRRLGLALFEQANNCGNRLDQYQYGDKALQYWREYIEWYDGLESEEKSLLTSNHVFIQGAVQFLGNSIIVRGNAPVSDVSKEGIRELFKAYSVISPEYFNVTSKTLWKTWLWRCPHWREDYSTSYKKLKKLYDDDNLLCSEEWNEYLYFLKSWIDAQELSNDALRGARNDILELENIFGASDE